MESAHEHGDRNLEEVAAASAWVRRLAVALARDADAGEDIAQDALLAAVRDRRRGGDVRAWLYGIVQNLSRMRLRSDYRRAVRERHSAKSEASVDPVLALERLELQESLLSAVRELPEPYRTTLILRWFEELTPEAIAQRTRTPVRTVHTRLQRALKMLRETLDRRAHGERSRWLAAWLPTIPQTAPLWPWVLAMQLKTKLAVAALAVAALSVWFVVESQDNPNGSSTTAAQQPTRLDAVDSNATPPVVVTKDANRSAIPTPAEASSTHSPAPTGLTVRSSIGLELAFFEWRTPVGDWRRQDLEHGRCAVTEMQLPCSVRAPGHVPARAENDGDQLVLEPDALLIIEGNDLRSCTSSIRIEDPYHRLGEPMSAALERACIGGYLSANEWAMAVSHDLIHDGLYEGDATAVVLWRDQHRADIHLEPIANVRGRWSLPCEDRPACAPLTVRLQRPDAAARTGRVSLRMTSTRNNFEDARWETFEWGRVATYSTTQLWVDERHTESGANEFTYPALPLGEPLLVFARDETSGAYGRIEFLHDGSPTTVELRPAIEIVARPVSAVDSSAVRDARVTCTFSGRTDAALIWSGGDGRTTHANDGVFRLLLPDGPLLLARTPLEPPSRGVVRVESAGFEPFEKSIDTSGVRLIDCGELRLTPRVAPIVLAPGHGLEPKSVEWMTLRNSARPELGWNIRHAASNPDDSLSVFLVESDDSTRETPLFDTLDWRTSAFGSTAWPADPPQWLVIHVLLGDRDEDWLFERRADGRFAAAPRLERELVLECGAWAPPDESDENADRWFVGWTWQGRWGQLATGPRRVGDVLRVKVSMPADGASIYWSAKGTPPGVLGAPLDVGGTIPVASLSGKLILR